ncbi:MAG: UDP-4-amino-4,6-dideoxy-N-acetyl-beta-L-altrosamine N-acetyltransferase [Marinobacter sp.]|nr:UDP-4-amino-4,6-dideoxy-N-acetyl-beta-L-altrosamine N-acetyltransferase [Marinobacter sp.]
MPLRPLSETDLDKMLEWRNAPEVRKNMYTSHEITKAEHKSWFDRMKHDDRARWYIYSDEDGKAEGVVYFTNYAPRSGSVFWGFYAAPDARRGVGSRMEIEALEHAFSDLGVHKLNCEVLASNPKVINLHKKFGFVEEGQFREYHFDGEQYVSVVRLGMIDHEWPSNRESARKRLAAYRTDTKVE